MICFRTGFRNLFNLCISDSFSYVRLNWPKCKIPTLKPRRYQSNFKPLLTPGRDITLADIIIYLTVLKQSVLGDNRAMPNSWGSCDSGKLYNFWNLHALKPLAMHEHHLEYNRLTEPEKHCEIPRRVKHQQTRQCGQSSRGGSPFVSNDICQKCENCSLQNFHSITLNSYFRGLWLLVMINVSFLCDLNSVSTKGIMLQDFRLFSCDRTPRSGQLFDQQTDRWYAT